MTIDVFHGETGFLSNFYQCKIRSGAIEFPSAEHMFQARKTDDPEWFQRIAAAPTSREAKALGRQAPRVSNWEDIKVGVMESVIATKFVQNPPLIEKLIGTGDQLLIEGNNWHDQFWGDCDCDRHRDIPGKNGLGIILMRYRLHVWRWQ